MSKEVCNEWPCGPVPNEWKRPEIEKIRKEYGDLNGMEIIHLFESKVSDLANCKYGVTTESGTSALFLSLIYLKQIGEIKSGSIITIPKNTYISVPLCIKNAGFKVKFEDVEWSGVNQLKPTRIWDGAVRFTENMYIGDNTLQMVSFHIKKRLPIGRGGMILTNDKKAANWIRQAKWNGRHEGIALDKDYIKVIGWDMYMTPEDAARGIIIFDQLKRTNPDSGSSKTYKDISNMRIFK